MYCKNLSCGKEIHASLVDKGSEFCCQRCLTMWADAQKSKTYSQQAIFDDIPMCVLELTYVSVENKIKSIKDAMSAFNLQWKAAKDIVDQHMDGHDVFLRCNQPTKDSCNFTYIGFEILKFE